MDKAILELAWAEFEMSTNYWAALFKNIVGFVPFGFCFNAYFSAESCISRPRLITVIVG
jgi:glycopeptide antibiotics resistance protein